MAKRFLPLWIAVLRRLRIKPRKSLPRRKHTGHSFIQQAASSPFAEALRGLHSACLGVNAPQTDSFRWSMEGTTRATTCSSSTFCVGGCGGGRPRTQSFRIMYYHHHHHHQEEEEEESVALYHQLQQEAKAPLPLHDPSTGGVMFYHEPHPCFQPCIDPCYHHHHHHQQEQECLQASSPPQNPSPKDTDVPVFLLTTPPSEGTHAPTIFCDQQQEEPKCLHASCHRQQEQQREYLQASSPVTAIICGWKDTLPRSSSSCTSSSSFNEDCNPFLRREDPSSLSSSFTDYRTAPSTIQGSPINNDNGGEWVMCTCTCACACNPVEEAAPPSSSSSSPISLQSEAMVVLSQDPFSDFLSSIKDMLVILGAKNLHALLDCYLHLNEPRNHAAIALAFVTAIADVYNEELLVDV